MVWAWRGVAWCGVECVASLICGYVGGGASLSLSSVLCLFLYFYFFHLLLLNSSSLFSIIIFTLLDKLGLLFKSASGDFGKWVVVGGVVFWSAGAGFGLGLGLAWAWAGLGWLLYVCMLLVYLSFCVVF